MNLTKNDLFFLLESIDATSDSENGSYQAEMLAEETRSALYRNELDIEGYARVEWIKFDPKNPKTFPTKNGNYLVVFYDEIRIAEWYDIFFTDPESKPFNDCVFYWMPLPEMPNV